MSDTSPQPDFGSDDDKKRIRRVINQRGLTGAANDAKWGRLIDTMRQRNGWVPRYRCKCFDGPMSRWDAEWWYHLPLPMMSVEWLDINSLQDRFPGNALKHETIDYSSWILQLLAEVGFCCDVVRHIVRLHGYLSKSFEGLDDLAPETQKA